MKQVNDSTKKKKWEHISYGIRLKIETLLKTGFSAREIAERIGYSLRTVQRELARGVVQIARTVPDEYAAYDPSMKRERIFVNEYSADKAQRVHERNCGNKGTKLKIGRDFAFVEYIEQKIGKERFSPYAALQMAKIEGLSFAGLVSVKTLYRPERTYGAKKFRKTFKTIPMDNGSEFLCQEGIERSCMSSKIRTTVYYYHPFNAFERGSSENANRLIRRHIHKGEKISQFSKEKIRWLEHF